MIGDNVSGIQAQIIELICDSTKYAPGDLVGRESENLHKDLGIDSLTLLEVALSIDQEFETDFTEEELLSLESVQRATEMVSERLESKKKTA